MRQPSGSQEPTFTYPIMVQRSLKIKCPLWYTNENAEEEVIKECREILFQSIPSVTLEGRWIPVQESSLLHTQASHKEIDKDLTVQSFKRIQRQLFHLCKVTLDKGPGEILILCPTTCEIMVAVCVG